MLKFIEFSRYGSNGRIAYSLSGGNCYFCGVDLKMAIASVLREIIKAIVREEGIKHPANIEWFNFETHRSSTSFQPGEYNFEHLDFHGKDPTSYCETLWRPNHCPAEILTLFGEFVGQSGGSSKIWKPEEARKAGYILSSAEKPWETPGMCFAFMRLHSGKGKLLRKLVIQAPEFVPAAQSMVDTEQAYDQLIVVDHEGYPELLKLSDGKRFAVWCRDVSGDN